VGAKLHPLALAELEKERTWNAPHLEALGRAYGEGRLTLLLGAGVSKGCGLPVWKELTSRLLRRALHGLYEAVGPTEAPLHERDIEAALKDRVRPMVARYVKAKLGEGYLEAVRQALYAGRERVSPTMKAILAMERLSAILTLNFDDLLERSARAAGVGNRFRPVYEPPLDLSAGPIPVYHTHGFLPLDPAEKGSSRIVFSEEDYHGLIHEARPWSDLVTMDLLARTTCLMIGTSGEDPNLRRLLDLTRRLAVPPRHYLLLKPPAPLPRDRRGLIRYTATRRALWDAFDHLGIEVLWIQNYQRDIPRILRVVAGGKKASTPRRRRVPR
jgi:hypothetical protein